MWRASVGYELEGEWEGEGEISWRVSVEGECGMSWRVSWRVSVEG